MLELLRHAQRWALGAGFDAQAAAEVRRQVLLENHEHYRAHVAVYRKACADEGVERLDELGPIKRRLMFADDLFKSYEPRWLDTGDFGAMTRWLQALTAHPLGLDPEGIASLDEWLLGLGRAGLRVLTSSGTSGLVSFVPRDEATWQLHRLASTVTATPLLVTRTLGTFWQRLAVAVLARIAEPRAFQRLTQGRGLPDFDAVFLDFPQGSTGNQALERELAPLFRRHHFLYDVPFSPAVARLLARGPRTAAERAQLARFQAAVVAGREANLARVAAALRASTRDGQRTFLFGAPAQCLELCQALEAAGATLPLHPGSLILFGGGWKAFGGQRISREALVAKLSAVFALPPARILEGYSMSEVNAFMLRCEHGRFHLPPLLEPVVFDEALAVLEGDDVRGTFGFLDPLARAYPGFIISGDEVRLLTGRCPCGLEGAAVTDIGRAKRKELKGCGGVMGAVGS